MDTISMFYPNPKEIVHQLEAENWRYVNDRASDFAYAHVAVIPELFGFVMNQGRIPTPSECARHLWELRAKKGDRELAIKRTKKLVQDFYRELHTFGLLIRSDLFSMVHYAKATDIDLGVDYTAGLLTKPDVVGIQAAMRARWDNDVFTNLKDARQRKRTGGRQFDGPIHWITNKDRPHINVNGVWLFTEEHVQDLGDEIKGNEDESDIVVQARFQFALTP